LVLANDGEETVCGRTTGRIDAATWSQTVTWTCVGCLLPDDLDRAIALDQFVAVPAGTIPRWEIYADLGS
jgi:hypothetical protein